MYLRLMLETPHVIVGAAIAKKIPNPLISLPLALTSHFLLDKIPHWNPHLNTETKKYGHITKKTTIIIGFDLMLSAASVFYIANTADTNTQVFYIYLGALAAILPDVVEGPYFFFHYKTKLIEKWIKFQKSIQTDTTVVPGLLTQLLTIIASLVWIK